MKQGIYILALLLLTVAVSADVMNSTYTKNLLPAETGKYNLGTGWLRYKELWVDNIRYAAVINTININGFTSLVMDTITKDGWIMVGRNAREILLYSNVTVFDNKNFRIVLNSGAGNAYACFNKDGVLYRSKQPCV